MACTPGVRMESDIAGVLAVVVAVFSTASAPVMVSLRRLSMPPAWGQMTDLAACAGRETESVGYRFWDGIFPVCWAIGGRGLDG